MLRFFASNSTSARNSNDSKENPASKPDQGGSTNHSASLSSGRVRRNGHTRGRSSGVQDLSAIYLNVPGTQLTEEPPSLTDTSGAGVGRGRRAPTEAVPSSVHNAAQALANRLYELEATKNPNPELEDSPQLSSITQIKEVGRNEIAQIVPPDKQAAATKPPRAFSRRYLPRKPSATTQNDRYPRYPLRVGTHPPIISEPATDGGHHQPLRRSTLRENETGTAPKAKVPLKATLYDGSSDLSLTPPSSAATSTATLHVLAVGVAYAELRDPEHDLNILRTSFGFNGHESEKTRFKSISGRGATPVTVEKATGELYREALRSCDSDVLILLTGEGDSNNRMHLMGGEFITDKDLRRWIWKLQVDSYPNHRTVTVILDYCRANPGIPLGVPRFGVEFIWSCSPGETAAALAFSSTQAIPRSCFLLSLMMAAYGFACAKSDLITAINYELHRLSRLLELKHRKDHEAGKCDACNKSETCPAPYNPQNPDWQQAGNMKSVYHLVDRLSKLDIVPRVYELFTRNKGFREVNGIPVGEGSSDPRPLHQNGTTQHNRGSSKPVHAASNTYTESQDHIGTAPHPPAGTFSQIP